MEAIEKCQAGGESYSRAKDLKVTLFNKEHTRKMDATFVDSENLLRR